MVIRDVTDEKTPFVWNSKFAASKLANTMNCTNSLQTFAVFTRSKHRIQHLNNKINDHVKLLHQEEVSGEEHDLRSSTSSSTTPTFQDKLARNKLATLCEILETLDNYHYIYMNISNSLLNKYFFQVRRLPPNCYF